MSEINNIMCKVENINYVHYKINKEAKTAPLASVKSK